MVAILTPWVAFERSGLGHAGHTAPIRFKYVVRIMYGAVSHSLVHGNFLKNSRGWWLLVMLSAFATVVVSRSCIQLKLPVALLQAQREQLMSSNTFSYYTSIPVTTPGMSFLLGICLVPFKGQPWNGSLVFLNLWLSINQLFSLPIPQLSLSSTQFCWGLWHPTCMAWLGVLLSVA